MYVMSKCWHKGSSLSQARFIACNPMACRQTSREGLWNVANGYSARFLMVFTMRVRVKRLLCHTETFEAMCYNVRTVLTGGRGDLTDVRGELVDV